MFSDWNEDAEVWIGVRLDGKGDDLKLGEDSPRWKRRRHNESPGPVFDDITMAVHNVS